MKFLAILLVLLLFGCSSCFVQRKMPLPEFSKKSPPTFTKSMLCPEWNSQNIMCHWEAWMQAAGSPLKAMLGKVSGRIPLLPNITLPDGERERFDTVELPRLSIDRQRMSVSGASSGGYMAVQLHFGFSELFKLGSAILAGGPFYCAENSILNAVTRCMHDGKDIPIDRLVKIARKWSDEGRIGSLEHVRNSKAYIFLGALDSVGDRSVANALIKFYEAFLPQTAIRSRFDIQADHAFVTDSYGNPCDWLFLPFINNCGFDLAGELLQYLHGPLAPRNEGAPQGRIIRFDQDRFNHGAFGMGSFGVASSGFVYIPNVCRESGAKCQLHVALHGCMQNEYLVGDEVAKHTGYNKWADTNRMVIVYPQTSLLALGGCWDWYGYESFDYANRNGPQMEFIKAVLDHISSGQ